MKLIMLNAIIDVKEQQCLEMYLVLKIEQFPSGKFDLGHPVVLSLKTAIYNF